MKGWSSWKKPSPLPGFGLSLGYTLACLGLFVLIPLSVLALTTTTMGWSRFVATVSSTRALSAYGLSFGAAFSAAAINGLFGGLLAWVLVRYRFPGRGLVDALVDLPLALPTAVAGVALTAVYSPKGWIGAPLSAVGIHVAYTRLGVVLALTFVGLPFVVRTLQPVLAEIDVDQEEAAATLGASRWQTFRGVLLPAITPPLLTGLSLSFARAVGEYGSIVFISGNMPRKTEVAPLLIMAKLEQFDYAGATAIAVVMLAVSFALLFAANRLQSWSRHAQRTV